MSRLWPRGKVELALAGVVVVALIVAYVGWLNPDCYPAPISEGSEIECDNPELGLRGPRLRRTRVRRLGMVRRPSNHEVIERLWDTGPHGRGRDSEGRTDV